MRVEHAFGTATIPSRPQRVVTVGFDEQDFALALGVVPVGVRGYFGYDYRQRPWAADLLPVEPLPVVGGQDGIDVEAVAAARPDLVLGVCSFTSEQGHATLSRIAPTVAESADHGVGGTPWQEQTLVTGRALGEQARAEALVAQVEGRFAAARREDPAWAGQSLALDHALDGHYLLGTDDLRTAFFADLGFTPAATSTPLSPERLDELDRDVLVVGGAGPQACADDPLHQSLDVVSAGRTVHLGAFDTDVLGALGFGSPLGLPHALDAIAPALGAAADGDPATAVEQPAA